MTTPADGPWTAQRERSNLWALTLMRRIAVGLGRPVARLLLAPIALYFLWFGGAAPRASAQYLRRVLGRAPTFGERLRHLHAFASTVLDRVYLLQQRFDGFDIRIAGTEHLDEVLARGQGALLIGAHLGSFEVMRALGQSRAGLRVAMVMYEDNARMINATLKAIAPDTPLHIIALGQLESMLRLRNWLDDGGVAGLLGDRSVPGAASARSVSHRLPFLGDEATFSDGPFRLAALLRRPVVFMTGLYLGGNRYELRFVPLADLSERPAGREAQDAAIADAQRRYVALLETLCREQPMNWFNFYDFWTP
jgi:predicted LPLAT superfamily acyltransferase